MHTTTLDLGPQAAEVTRIVAGVRDGQLCHPTPCAGMNMAALLDHLVGLTLACHEVGRDHQAARLRVPVLAVQ